MAGNRVIGFIGVGSQGAPMARRLVDAGHPTVLWARRPESLKPYADTPAKTAATVAELGAQCDHVGLCVLADKDVREVCAALMPAMKKGSVIAIHSTIHPDTCVELANQATAHGLVLLDAPVSGGSPAAEAGKLTVMVGGDAKAFADAKPIFAAFGSLIIHVGGIGAGQHAKLINNSLLAANMAVAHQALEAAAALKLDRKQFVELINASSGRSFGFEVVARMPNLAAFGHGASLLAKDVRLLGETLRGDPSFAPFRDLGGPFMDQILKAAGMKSA